MADSSPATKLLSLNQQAIALLRLGIPLDLGLGGEPISRLSEINERLVGQSSPSVDALFANHAFPDRYESVARMLLAADDPAKIFQSISEPAQDLTEAARPIRRAITEPVVVMVLAYFGMLFVCFFVLPHIQAQYEQSRQDPIGFTALLIRVQETLPIWAVAAPLVGLIGIWLWRTSATGWITQLLPGNSSYSRCIQSAAQTTRIAALVESGMNPDEAISLAREKHPTPTPVGTLVKSVLDAPTADSQPNRAQSRSLEQIARFYRYLASDRRQAFASKLPAILGVLLAGCVVLGYALVMFVPWIEVLTNLSEAGGLPRE